MNDHIPDEVQPCKGHRITIGLHYVLATARAMEECSRCARPWVKNPINKPIMPWFGHGSCPDKLEMEK